MAARTRYPGVEFELTLSLERASELRDRAQRANTAAQHEIDRALEIADELRHVSSDSHAQADRLRSRQRGR